MNAPLALISLTDKSGVVEFARGLKELGFEILSTGGTAQTLRQGGVRVTEVAAYTGSPEILDGRVKTLHPKIHGGLLYDRADPKHRQEAEQQGIRPIKILAVNLYKFEDQAVQKKLTISEAIHYIDVGGPTMLRAAAKNWQHVLPVIDPADYERVLQALKVENETASESERVALGQELATKVFACTAAYDQAIAAYFTEKTPKYQPSTAGNTNDQKTPWSKNLETSLRQVQCLRYGENPHQPAAVYAPNSASFGFGEIDLLQGKELSYNNLLDLDAACALTAEFKTPAVAIIKHTNPCGAASRASGLPEEIKDQELAKLFHRALASDPKSAFGGIVAINTPVGAATAEAITSIFTECVAAPDFSVEALEIFGTKKNLRVLRAPFANISLRAQAVAKLGANAAELLARRRSIFGAELLQGDDVLVEDPSNWQLVSGGLLSVELEAELLFAMLVAKHVKSNAIVYTQDSTTLAVGAGQMSRIDSATYAAEKALAEGRSLQGAIMASDAFFPFRDTVDLAAKYGIKAIIQPGGSVRDQESIDAAKEHGITMVLSGVRHFRH
jgi:phosphoribosylaminoimidazolecarboxamide formyltransferase/IMP cyclohydrolase